jgi:serine/threonine protein kinase
MNLTKGQNLQNYQIINAVGSGGMSTVYVALDTKLQRKVALKVLHPHLLGDKVALERFKREALSAAKMDHPNVVRIYDYISFEDTHAIAMEYIPGRDVESIARENKCLSFEITSYIMNFVAIALKEAHGHGIMHRDVKPSNIILHKDNRIMLTDFGLAHHFSDAHLTMNDAVAGTPQFMSPEQISGKKLTFSSDIYSWAVTFYYLLMGKLPYASSEFALVVSAIQNGKIVLDPRSQILLPGRYYDLLERCLYTNPQKRLASGQELHKYTDRYLETRELDLNAALDLPLTKDTASISLSGTPEKTMVFKPSSSTPKKAFFIICGICFLALAGYLGNAQLQKKDNRNRPAPALASEKVRQTIITNHISESKLLLPHNPIKPITKKPIAPEKPDIPSGQNMLLPEKQVLDSGKIFIFVTPWAGIIIDDIDYGKTPLKNAISLPEGKHRLKLLNDFYEPEEKDIFIIPGKVVRQNFELTRRLSDKK